MPAKPIHRNSTSRNAKGLIGKVTNSESQEVEVEMAPPTCPYCLEGVKEGATRCPHCAGEFSEPAAPKPKA